VREVWGTALLFLLVIGGIYRGWFSPTEAAAVGALGAFLIALLLGRMSKGALLASAHETVQTTGMIFLILIGASVFNYFIETAGVPQLLVGWVEEAGLPRYAVLLTVMAFYVVLGCFLDSLSMILLTVPFVFPLIAALQFDPVWFGILLVTVAEIGLITPPVGMNLFVIQGTAGDLRLETIVRGIGPFLIADLIRLLVLIALPQLVLWLPARMAG
jgi:tripartite ATP-independent transporter DctM subunit